MKPEELKSIRVKLGHSQASLALLLGLSWRQVNRYEAGDAPIPEVVRLALRSVPSRKSVKRDKEKMAK